MESKIGAFEKERNSVEEFKKDRESIEKEIKDRDLKLGQFLKDKSDLTASLEAAMSDLEANRNQLKLVQDEAAKMEELRLKLDHDKMEIEKKLTEQNVLLQQLEAEK